MSGSGVDETATPPLRRNRVPHPSAPVTLQGPGLGSHVRVPLGETGFDVFPLFLGGGEFGWNVDARASHEILDKIY